jgi:hypothetical protein
MEPSEFDRLLAAYDKVRRAHPDLAKVVVVEGGMRLEATRTPMADDPVMVLGTERAAEIDRLVAKVTAELEAVSPMSEADVRMFGGWLRTLLANSNLEVAPQQ